MRSILSSIVVLMAICVSAAQALVVADFDNASKPNNVGGDFGAWDKDPTDMTQTCVEEFDTVNTRQGQGSCMMLTYDVDSPNAAFNGFWMKLENLDATKFSKLVFWAKGDAAKGCTPRAKIEIKTASERGAYYVDGISSVWTKFEIPLMDFYVSDLSALTEFVVVFEDHSSVPKTGILYLDDVSFE